MVAMAAVEVAKVVDGAVVEASGAVQGKAVVGAVILAAAVVAPEMAAAMVGSQIQCELHSGTLAAIACSGNARLPILAAEVAVAAEVDRAIISAVAAEVVRARTS
jgi:hypothetical protein